MSKFRGENDELLDLLYTNLASVQFNRHNLEVYLSIAHLCRQNLLMFKALEGVSNNLDQAQQHAGMLQYADAVAALDQALDVAARIRDERNQALHDVKQRSGEHFQKACEIVRSGQIGKVTPRTLDPDAAGRTG